VVRLRAVAAVSHGMRLREFVSVRIQLMSWPTFWSSFAGSFCACIAFVVCWGMADWFFDEHDTNRIE
jgi:hypothetical protein